MPRPPRLQAADTWHHVFNRGAAKQPVFLADKDRNVFLNQLGEACETFDLECHGYCLMGNHYHLILHTRRANLSDAMRSLAGKYTKYFNHEYQRDGALFRGRFRSILLDADEYLLTLSRYIHLNPVKDGNAKTPEAYRWSSYSAYIGTAKRPPWLHTAVVLNLTGGARPKQRYRNFVHGRLELDEGGAADFEQTTSSILGDKGFRDRIARRLDQPLPAYRPSLEAIIAACAAEFDVGPVQIFEPHRGPGQANQGRIAALLLASREGKIDLATLAARFGFANPNSLAASLSRWRKIIATDAQAKARLKRIHQAL